MKRVVCLLLVVSIAYAGCADKKTSKVTLLERRIGWRGAMENLSESGQRIEKLERELAKAKTMPEQNEALLVRITELEAALESQRAVSRAILAKWEGEQSKVEIMHKQNKTLLVKIDELESQMTVESVDKTLLVKISKLEAVIKSQKVALESSKNVHRLYEAATEYQRVALDSLLSLCRLYEAEIESQREATKVFL